MVEAYLVVSVVVGLVTAGIMTWGLRRQREEPTGKWPIVTVGLLAGLLPGIGMLAAGWAGDLWPDRRRLVDGVTIVGGGFLAFAAAMAIWAPTLDVGPVLGGGRIERPAHGFALTFPAGWTAQEVTPEGAKGLISDEALPDGQSLVLAAERSHRGGYCLVTFDDPSVRGEPVLLGSYAGATEASWTRDPEASDVRRVRVDLPAGPAWRIDVTWDHASESAYLVRGPAGLYAIEFVDDDPPADRWLSVARTFEFLPDAETGAVASCPVIGSGRIEQPEHGFAMTFPVGWTVEEAAEDFDAIMDAEPDPRVAALRRIVLWAEQTGADGYCSVEDLTALAQAPPPWTTVGAAARDIWSGWRDDPRVTDARRALVGLPAGRTGHIWGAGTDGMSGDAYIFTNLTSWVSLECWSTSPPADRWRSIAESFAFLAPAPSASAVPGATG